MHEYKIIHDADRAAKRLQPYTFTIDGTPTLVWCGSEMAVRRKIDRIKAGRTNAFGHMPTVKVGTQEIRPEPLREDKVPQARAYLLDQGFAADKVEEFLKKLQEQPRARVFPVEPLAETQTGTTRSGKTRPVRPRWKFEMDGQCCEQDFTTEAEAREEVAVRSFLTSGKLGRLDEAAKLVEKQYGVSGCRGVVCPKRHKVLVRDGEGNEYAVGVGKSGELRVKRMEK